MAAEPGTWHYGLVADWWAAFNHGGDEIAYFGRFVEAGQPALDAGCGTGRLLLPWLRAGYDVDGCDVSADMIERCRRQAREEGLEPTLLVQPLHELSPPRRYRTAVACGVFGLGSTRAQDEQALLRLRNVLEPGGRLLLDVEVPYASHMRWRFWPKREREQAELPEPWPDTVERRLAPDGSELALRSRAVSVDPLDQSVVLELKADKWVDGEHVAEETHRLSMRGYFRNELIMMFERAGFHDVEVHGDYTALPPTPESEFLVFSAVA